MTNDPIQDASRVLEPLTRWAEVRPELRGAWCDVHRALVALFWAQRMRVTEEGPR